MTVHAPSHRARSLTAAVVLGVVVGGCGDGSDNVVATLAEQRTKWEASGIETYEFTLFWGAFISWSGDYRVTVVDGAPAGMRRIDAVDESDPSALAEVPETIDEVFDLLEREGGDADRVDASYDPQMGYPVAVLVDRIEDADDDELEIRISDLTLGTG